MDDDVRKPLLTKSSNPLSRNGKSRIDFMPYQFIVSLQCEDDSWFGNEALHISREDSQKRLMQIAYSLLRQIDHQIPSQTCLEFSCLLTSNQSVQMLNKTYRGQDKPTNILSFESGRYVSPWRMDHNMDHNNGLHKANPCPESQPVVTPILLNEDSLKGSDMPLHLGDLVLAYDVVYKEAKEQNKPFLHHVTHLFIHGLLHLFGYDHETEEEACVMETIEINTLKHEFNYPNPYQQTGN